MTEHRLSLEWLESRQLLAGAFATLATNGASWNATQNSVTIEFNQDWVNGVLMPGDVQLVSDNPSAQTPLLGNPTFDAATGSVETIPVLTQPLPPGDYSIVLLDDLDTEEVWPMNGPLTLGGFTILPPPVVPPPVTLSNATDLGTIGTQAQTIAGSLDLSSQENVDLYKITLGPGHFWRLGVELDAQRISSNLRGALTLFDQQGDVLATRDAGTGLPSAPADPYLFTGLKPGVYYIGVSGAGNLGGQSGGYNPVTGAIGSAGQAQAGGPYDLQVVADPADSLTQVLGFSLQRADALEPTPTGLTLTFSSPIDPNSLLSGSPDSSPNLVYDASGQVWPVTLSSYEANQVSFAFQQPLPPGQYTVVDPSSGGLTDLTGRAAVSPGQNPGVLATFTVEPQTSRVVAGDLGILWPNTQYQVSQFATISPGQEVVSRVVVTAPGLYNLETTFTQGSVEILRAGPDGVVDVGTASSGPSNSYPMQLEAGVYLVSFRNIGTLPTVGHWTFQFLYGDDFQLNNGVGQSGALSLSLINPMTSGPTSGTSPGVSPVLAGNLEPVVSPSSSQSGSNSIAAAAPVGSGEAVAATGVSVIPTSLMVTVNTGLLGPPTSQNETVAVVGPVVAGGSTALASGFSGLLPGIIYRSSGVLDEGTPRQADSVPLVDSSSAPNEGLAEAGIPSSADPGVTLASASSADAQALTKADQITELAGRLGRWLGLNTGGVESPVDNAPTDSDLLVRNETKPGKRGADGSAEMSRERMTEADLGMPIGLILAAAAAYRLRQFASRWWRRTRGPDQGASRPEAGPPGPRSGIFHGSHGSYTGTTRVRTCRRR